MLLILLVAVAGVARQQAHALITHSPQQRAPITETPADRGLAFEALSLTTSDGLHLATWYIVSRNGAAVIVVHGHKGNRSQVLGQAALLAAHGYGVVMSDLRTHGQSDGALIGFGKYEVRDLEADYQYLLTRPDVDHSRIGVLGVSMGANVALLYGAYNHAIQAVVAESASASFQDWVTHDIAQTSHLPPWPFGPLTAYFAGQEIGLAADEVAASKSIGAISPRAVFILQGSADTLVPLDNGQTLYDAAGQPKELWLEPRVGDSQFINQMPDMYEQRVIAFFNHYVLD